MLSLRALATFVALDMAFRLLGFNRVFRRLQRRRRRRAPRPSIAAPRTQPEWP
jgi:hypothetical protein